VFVVAAYVIFVFVKWVRNGFVLEMVC